MVWDTLSNELPILVIISNICKGFANIFSCGLLRRALFYVSKYEASNNIDTNMAWDAL